MANYELYSATTTIWKIPNATYSPQRAGFQKTPSWWRRVSQMRRFIQPDEPLIHQTDDEAQQTRGPTADKLRALINSTSNDAIDCIGRLILELQDVRNNLRHEGERLEREINSYVHLCDTARLAARAIAESLVKSKTAPGEFDRSAAE